MEELYKYIDCSIVIHHPNSFLTTLRSTKIKQNDDDFPTELLSFDLSRARSRQEKVTERWADELMELLVNLSDRLTNLKLGKVEKINCFSPREFYLLRKINDWPLRFNSVSCHDATGWKNRDITPVDFSHVNFGLKYPIFLAGCSSVQCTERRTV